MSICKKCNTSIKPASLATYSGEDSYHPTCISCSKCQRPLWGRGFRRNKQRLLECEPDCESNKFGPQSIAKNKPANENGGAPGGPPSGPGMPKGFRPVFEESQSRYPPQQQHQPPQNVPPQNNPPQNYPPQNYPPQNYPDPHNPALHNPAPHNAPQNYPPQNYPPQNYPPQNYAPQSGMTPLPPIGQNYYQQQPSNYDLNSFRRQGTSDMNKTCKSCGQSLHNRRYLTYETGDMICQECDYNSRVPIPRVRSAHMIVCSCCGSTLQGTKYFTEKNGDIVCEKCDASGARCTQCKQLFRLNETRRTLANGAAYHAGCFMCSSCGKLIQTSEFYQTETRQPMCLDCYEISRLPKCFICNKHISGTYFMLDNKPVHDECFKCSMCAKSLGNDPNGFFRNKTTNDPICMSCNMKLNGARCARCGQVIEADGITFNSKDYHKQCFTCDSCGVELSKMKKSLTDRNGTGKFCEPCHIKLFAPKCAKCNQAIPPYLPFTQIEDKTYHKECFACSRCKQSLANKKFFKNGNLTLCEHCN